MRVSQGRHHVAGASSADPGNSCSVTMCSGHENAGSPADPECANGPERSADGAPATRRCSRLPLALEAEFLDGQPSL